MQHGLHQVHRLGVKGLRGALLRALLGNSYYLLDTAMGVHGPSHVIYPLKLKVEMTNEHLQQEMKQN